VPVKKYDGEIIMKEKHKTNIDYKEYFKDKTNFDGNKMDQSVLVK
jgi:hypothetical protein